VISVRHVTARRLCDHVAGRRHLRLENAQGCSLGVEFVDQVQDLAGRATESVEPQHDEFITGPQELHDGLRTGSGQGPGHIQGRRENCR